MPIAQLPCLGCMQGNHAEHEPPPRGLRAFFVGTICPCTGQCNDVVPKLYIGGLDENSSMEDLLTAVDDSLRNGASMTRGNLAFELLCMRLGVNRNALSTEAESL